MPAHECVFTKEAKAKKRRCAVRRAIQHSFDDVIMPRGRTRVLCGLDRPTTLEPHREVLVCWDRFSAEMKAVRKSPLKFHANSGSIWRVLPAQSVYGVLRDHPLPFENNCNFVCGLLFGGYTKYLWYFARDVINHNVYHTPFAFLFFFWRFYFVHTIKNFSVLLVQLVLFKFCYVTSSYY